MSTAVAQIGHVISTAGIGSAESLNPYPKAKRDKDFRMEGGVLVHKKTGQKCRAWRGNRNGKDWDYE